MSQVLTGTHFIKGDEACAEGAIAAGCRFFGGYPITPASEIAEWMARRMPLVGGEYMQMEDELASMAAVVGASNAGVKSMTATSGPGMSLMLENIGLGIMMEPPCVVVNIQRGGPSTGMPTLTSQADMMQARWGSHGDYEMIAYVPNSVQEMFDLTITAFNTSEVYRTPVVVLGDQVIGHMTGRVVIPEQNEIELIDRRTPEVEPGQGFLPFDSTEEVPPMALAGMGYNVHVTGLTHDDRGYPDISPEASKKLLDRIIGKIRNHAEEIIELDERLLEDAEIAVVAYGSTSQSAWRAVLEARELGIPVGMLRLVTAWPFPSRRIEELGTDLRAVIVPEVNYGQMVHPVREYAGCPVFGITHAGGGLLQPLEILRKIKEVA